MEHINDYFKFYLSDKSENGYGDVYNEVFSPRRNDYVKLLEIGIGTLNPTHFNMLFWKEKHPEYRPGASLRAFQDYFPYGTIIGIDIQEDCMMKDKRIGTFMVDSTNKIACDEIFFGYPLDIVIDDGDHNYLSQIKTFENFFGKIRPRGIYLLEDLESPDELVKYFSTTKFNWEMRDRMIIIKK